VGSQILENRTDIISQVGKGGEVIEPDGKLDLREKKRKRQSVKFIRPREQIVIYFIKRDGDSIYIVRGKGKKRQEGPA